MKTNTNGNVSIQILLPFLLILGINFNMLAQQGQTLSFTVTNGAEERCAKDSLVKIRIKPNPDLILTEVILRWGDGSPDVTILPGESLDRNHTFPGPSFLEECNYNASCVATQGFCFTISAFAKYSDAPLENISKIITFQTPPRPDFSYDPAFICEDQSISFTNRTCPSNDDSMTYTWILPNGDSIKQEDMNHTFSSEGQIPLTMIAQNNCGKESVTKDIQVNPLAIARPTLDSGSISFDNGIYRVCLGEGGKIRLNGDDSETSTRFRWTVSPNRGFQWNGEMSNDTARLTFNEIGLFTITLEVDNGCDIPSTASFEVDVLDSSSLVLEQQEDECLSLSYTPSPFNPNAKYYIDGDLVPDGGFPVTLEAKATPYVVEAILPDLCGDLVKEISFRVFSPTTPSLVHPSQDTSICSTDSRLLLQASPPGGAWNHERVIHEGENYYFDLSGLAGAHTLEYVLGSGDCERSVQLNIQIEEVFVDIGPAVEELCLDHGDFILTAVPTGGTWEGPGITDPAGIFNTTEAGDARHELTYIYTDPGTGCTVEYIKTIIVHPTPNLLLVDSIATCYVNAAIRLQELTQLSVVPDGGTFSWTGEGIVDEVNGIYNPTELGRAGVDTIDVTYTSPAGCQTNRRIYLSIDDLVFAQTISDTTLCLGGNASLALPAQPDGGTWEGPGINRQTGVIDLTQVSGSTIEYCYTIQAGTPCENQACVNITFVEGGTVNAEEDLYVCESMTSIQLTGGRPGGGQWSGLGLGDNNVVAISMLDTGANTFTYSVPSLPAGCNSDQMAIFVDRLPQPSLVVDSVGCVDEPISMAASDSNASRWEWEFGDRDTMSGQVVTNTYSPAGHYEITLTASSLHPETNEPVCINTLRTHIFINEPPAVVDFNLSTQEDCGPLSVNITNMSEGSLLNYQWEYGNGETSTITQPGIITYPPGIADTTYYIELGVTNGCGDSRALDSVKVKAPARARFGPQNASYCSGEVIELINTSYGNPDAYYWEYGNGLTSTDSIPREIEYITGGTYTQPIQLIVENECNADTLIREIEIVPTDVTAFFFTEKTEICIGEEICFENLSTFHVDVLYDFGDGNTSVAFNPCHVFDQAGDYTVKIQAFGCGFDADSVVIKVNPEPNPVFQAPNEICINQPIPLDNLTSDARIFRWYQGDSLRSILQAPILHFNQAGQISITLEAENQFGCTQSTSKEIDLMAPPMAIPIIDSDSVCVGNPVALSHTPQIGITDCLWNFNNGSFSAICDTSITYDSEGLKDIDLIVGDDLGCKDTASFSIYARALPISRFHVESTAICHPTEIQFFNTSIKADSYHWNFGDGNTSSMVNPTHRYEEGGEYMVQLIALREGICSATYEEKIVIEETPDANFEILDSTNCIPQEITFSAQSTDPELEHTWSTGDDKFYYDPVFTHLYTAAGTFPISLIVTNPQSGCSDTLRKELTLYPPPILTYTVEHNSCFGQSAGAIDLEISGGAPPYQTNWSDNYPELDRSELVADTYDLSILDGNNCRVSASIEILEPPVITVEKSDDAIVSCYGGNDGYLEVETQGGEAPYTYRWSNGSTETFILNVAAGKYTVSIVDNLGCERIKVLEVEENPAIEPNDELKPIICFDDKNGSITLNPMGGVPPYVASLEPDGHLLQGLNFRFDNLSPGSYTLEITDSEGCSWRNTYELLEPSKPFVDILPADTIIRLGDSLYLPIVHNIANPVINWTPALDLNPEDQESPMVRPLNDQLYQVLLNNEFGCLATDKVFIQVEKDRNVFIPNAFSPNGDGSNEIFRIRSINPGVLQIDEFRIFDQFGQLLFEQLEVPPNDPQYGWDGRNRGGQDVQPGVYTYYAMINYLDLESKLFEGKILLIR